MHSYLYLLILILFTFIYILIFLFPLTKGAPYVPTRQENISRLIEILNKYDPKSFKNAIDLGSGDGRVMFALADIGIKCDGIEQNKVLYKLTKKKIENKKMQEKCEVYNTNFFKSDLSKYDLVILFQIPYIMHKLKKKFIQELKPNTLICSYSFKIPNLKEDFSCDNWHIYRIMKSK